MVAEKYAGIFDGRFTLDEGLLARPCPRCGWHTVHQAIETDEASDGELYTYGVVLCTNCLWRADDLDPLWQVFIDSKPQG